MRLCEFEIFVYSRVVIEDEVVFRMGVGGGGKFFLNIF